MITFLGLVIGIPLMVVGFFAVWKTRWFIDSLGDISAVFSNNSTPWLSWKLVGLFLIIFGYLLAFGLFGALFGGITKNIFFLGSG